jgi:hypothetical protein
MDLQIQEILKSECMKHALAHGSITIFPNSTSGIIRIQFDQKANDQPYQIHDQYGRLVQSGVLNGHQNEIHITEGDGLYFFKIGNEVSKVQVTN